MSIISFGLLPFGECRVDESQLISSLPDVEQDEP